jgi:molybdenum cofactor cytidylyltransferase
MVRAGKRRRTVPSPLVGVTAIVLAAGASSRMGQPKPLLTLLGQPLLARVLDTVRRIRPVRTVVVLGAAADRVRAGVDLTGTTVVVNADFSDGMGSSLRRGAAAAGASGPVLVVLGDQPLVRPKTLETLIRRHASGGARILVPTFEGVRGNPILLDPTLIPELDSLRGDLGCRAIFPQHEEELVEVPVNDPGILIDVDTPSELARLERALDGHSTPTVARLRPLVADRVALHSATPMGGLSHPERRPDADLLIVGDAPVARAVATLGGVLGYRVTVVAPGARPSNFPDGVRWEPDLAQLPKLVAAGTFAVVASSGMYDEAALQGVLRGSPRYVGLVSSHRRGQTVLESLRAKGISDVLIRRIRTPAGIDIAARDPGEIALSILSEITKVRRTEAMPVASVGAAHAST